jgi:hypothetical protein
MARLFVLAFNESEAYVLVKKLRNFGHKVAVAEPKAPEFVTLLKQQVQPIETFVGDCSRQPSHVREAGNYIRSLKAYRDTPFLLYHVKPEDDARTLERVPGARLLRTEAELLKALPGAPTSGAKP